VELVIKVLPEENRLSIRRQVQEPSCGNQGMHRLYFRCSCY
jgi:hypothetical protein